VFPRDSTFFEFYATGSDSKIVPLHDSPIYKEDWIGLKQLDEKGRLVFIEVDGGHIEYETRW
jgi:palmitoyl-protein thioesterase